MKQLTFEELYTYRYLFTKAVIVMIEDDEAMNIYDYQDLEQINPATVAYCIIEEYRKGIQVWDGITVEYVGIHDGSELLRFKTELAPKADGTKSPDVLLIYPK